MRNKLLADIQIFRYGITTIAMFFVVIFSGQLNQFSTVSNANWLYFILIGLTTGSGATFLYYYGLTKVKATISAIIELLFPISAILFDYIFNGSKLNLIQWGSAAVMLYAIYKLNARKRTQKTLP